MKTWDIWVEGYAATGDSAPASCVARGIPGETFKDAVIAFYSGDSLFRADKLTWWGCRIYDNRIDAQRSFG